ncbi:MAG: fatty acid desaturase [Gemmatimonadaceae bacterium]|nr:fatty acid desaturase [Gloeobacterales cyanobacterium ES-bin-141]
MQEKSLSSSPEVYGDFQDYQKFESHRRLNKQEMFDRQFMDFMNWFKRDIHARYSKKDFQRIELKSLTTLLSGSIGLVISYVLLHHYLPQYALLWGIPMFAGAVYFGIQGEVMHMRTHSPNNLTGIRWLDKAIDYFGLALTGISPGLFGRRHLSAHYNDISSLSKIFSEIWITFDKVPISYYARPHLLLKFLLNQQFCEEEKINRKTLLIETIAFYIYLTVLVTELFFGSYFLLVFHLIPGFLLASSQIMSGTIVHSATDSQNSFESNGLMDYRTAEGLFKVPLWFYGLFNNGFFVNHGIHHAYPQVPLEIVTNDYRRYHEYILDHYTDVRYNKVLTHRVQADLLARLGPPNLFDYVVAFFCSLLGLFAMMLTVLGLPVPPTIFEMLLVDYRIYFVSTPTERMLNRIAFFESVRLEERYRQIAKPNVYMEFVYARYRRMKEYVKKHPLPASTQNPA